MRLNRPRCYAYAAALLVVCAGSLLWQTYVAQALYFDRIGHLVCVSPRVAPALVLYVLYSAGVVRFCVRPRQHPRRAVILGAQFGLVTHATGALMNFAMLQPWDAWLTVARVGWGVALSAAAAAAARLAWRALPPPDARTGNRAA
jgi:uncharacterized membrane protein